MSLATATSLEALVASLAERAHGDDAGLVHLERLPARPARHREPARPLPPEVLERLGVDRLWTHQAEGLDLARSGRSVVLATGTASGKSLCYQAAIAEAAADPVRPGSALLCFPTKALAQDQLHALARFGFPGVVPATYDGDTGPDERTWARRHANVVLTNPEMLHCGLLPHHERWATFLMRLRYVVIDELHTLRGVFGSHVANLLRRLRRLCASYGSSPTFVLSSATIGEPSRLASALCGLPVEQVTGDGSPRGERLFGLWNPPVVDDRSGARAAANGQAAGLLAELVAGGHRTIAFCRSRKSTELVAAEVRRRVDDELGGSVRPYRGGYLPAERRQIETELFAGRLRAVVATTALELGIDIGSLDACLLNGFPGTIASLWQQAGRAGRTQQQSLALLVAGEDQLDHYYLAHPDELFSRPPEPAVINPTNPHVLDAHLACAAYEQPLRPADERWWGEALHDGVRRLVLDDRLKLRSRLRRTGPPGSTDVQACWAARGWPSRGVGLRSGAGDEYRIALADGQLVGTVDEGRAFDLVHPGATYLHQGATFQVTALDLDDHAAIVEPTDGSRYTVARSETDVAVLGVDRSCRVGGAELWLGDVEITSQVTGYQVKDVATRDVLSRHELDLPPTRLATRAFWYTITADRLAEAGVAPADVPGTLHAAEHAAIGLLPLFAICDRWDVGGVSTARQADTGLPTIVVYDGYPGGAGVAELGYEAGDRHLAATLDLVERCRCRDGCPSCVQSPKCGSWNEPLDKAGAVAVLAHLLGRPVTARLAS